MTPLNQSIVLILNGLAHYAKNNVQRAAVPLLQRRQCDVPGALREEIHVTKGASHVA